MEGAGDPSEFTAPGSGHHLIVQRLRALVHHSELLQGEASGAAAQLAVNGLDRDVACLPGSGIATGEHQAAARALEIAGECLVEVEATNGGSEFVAARHHHD